MVAGMFLGTALLCFTAVSSLPLIKPSDEVCQSLSTSCQDLWVASGCKTVKTCIHEVWEKLEVPLDKSNVCNICKEMVKEARDQLLSNETQEELREVLEGSCNLIPVGFVSEMCRQVVDSLIPDLIDMLVSRMDPDQVCSVAGLCNPDFMTQGLQTKLQQSLLLSTFQSRIMLPSGDASVPALVTKKSSGCVKCKDAMKYSKKMLNNISEDRMKSIVVKACEDRLGKQSPECQAIGKVFFPPIFKYLRKMNPDIFCAHLKHCTLVGSPKPEAPLFTMPRDELTCDFCKQVVEHLREILASNATQEQLKQAILNACEELGPAAEECQKLLDDYFDMVYSYILEALTPDDFCAAIGLCDPTTKGGMNSQEKAMNKVIMKIFPPLEQHKNHLLNLKLKKYGKVGPSYKSASSIPLVKVIPALPKKYLEANTSVAIPMVKLFPSQKAKAGDIITCSLCKSLINLVEQLLPANMTVEAISDLLDHICDLFPASTDRKCREFIDTNRDIIIKFLTEDAAPEVVCHLITLCSTPPVSSFSSYSNCDFCQDIVQFLYSELKNNSTEEELRLLMENVCHLFPGESGKKCLNIVDTYFNLVMSMILQEFTPAQICKELGFCQPSKQAVSSVHTVPLPTNPVAQKTKSGGAECGICLNIVQFVYNELKENSTEEEIKELLDQACSLFPEESRQKCLNMINTYLDILVSLITQEFTPQQICQTLGFCPSSKQAPSPVHAVRQPTKHVVKKNMSGAAECDICVNVVQFVYSELKDESTEEEIKQLLDKACSLFPGQTREKCVNMINTYLDILVSMITQQFSPDQICQTLGFCPSLKRALSRVHAVRQPTKHAAKKSGPDCDICITVVQYVYNELKDNSTEEEIKQLLDKACSVLSGKSREKCVSMVNTYLDLLVSLLIEQLSPEQICQTLGMCPNSKSPLLASGSHLPKQGAPTGGECEICKNIIQFIYNEMQEKSSEEEVKKLLYGVCNLFAEAERQKCVDMVNTYVDVLVPMLMSRFPPAQICQNIRMCPSLTSTPLPSAPKSAPLKKVADPDPECDFCRSVVKLVYDELSDNKTEACVRKALDHVCDLCPDKEKCLALVNNYYDRLLSLLLQEVDPNLICKDFLHVCLDGARGDMECTFCQYALHFIQNQLVDNVTEARVQEVLDKLCDELPQQFSDECKAFVEEYGPALMVLLAQEIDPSIVCVAIKACPKDGVRRQPEAFVSDVKLGKCDTCTTVVDYVEKILQSKPNDKEITKLIENVCKAVPKNMQSDCASLVDLYGPYLLDAIGNIGNSHEICKFVDMCSDGTAPSRVLGSKQCTQGPSYWCGTPEQAASCNAQEYCKKKVWKQ